MFSDQDMGKKESETDDLVPFLGARQFVTGNRLSWISGINTECPDFICAREDGSNIGVELTKVTEDYEAASLENLRYGEVNIYPYKTLETIHYLIDRKEKARVKRYFEKVKENILVLQLVDGSFDQLRGYFDDLEVDFVSHGFAEIWLADYSGLEAYGDIELFGLFPSQWWGFHSRPWPERKPFG